MTTKSTTSKIFRTINLLSVGASAVMALEHQHMITIAGERGAAWLLMACTLVSALTPSLVSIWGGEDAT